MKTPIPIIELSKPEQLWLKEVYSRNKKGEKFVFKDIWSKLHKKLPTNFRPVDMDQRLIDASGENIRLFGVIALQKNTLVLKRINAVIKAIGKMLLKDPSKEKVVISEIGALTKLSSNDISFIFTLVNDFAQFYRGSSSSTENRMITSIDIGGSDDIYYNYIQFPGIETLIALKSNKDEFDRTQQFTYKEEESLSNKIDQILKDLENLKTGQEILWTDLTTELKELKELYILGKKNWRQLFMGKLLEMVAAGVISETISKKIANSIGSVFKKFFEIDD